ncbi:low density lipoprotein receptor adapter protein 1-B-like [Oppia nitens]|uniref:low density lipoprotein receptor adapter protein 1-B-like n=1 Tax=Oppia nitens TaxID=1686743 RepID=UPI0023DCA293|nr:low density lipoprotein receptor adapter protein 1-B-like [Oppia nitens]
MAAILRTFGIKKPKHKKLPEDWTDCKAPVIEGITFYCKYLGSTVIEEPSSDILTAEAIKRIIQMAKVSSKKLRNVSINVKPVGISASDSNSGEELFNLSIYRISYCSADATFDRVVAFIATNANETHECHAFLTPKRKIAEATALTISQAFSIAYDKWQQIANNGDNNSTSQSTTNTNHESNELNKKSFTERPLIDLSTDENIRPPTASFDDNLFKFNDNKLNGQQLRNNLNIGNFEQLQELVQKEVNESQNSEKFFADDDLFSL